LPPRFTGSGGEKGLLVEVLVPWEFIVSS